MKIESKVIRNEFTNMYHELYFHYFLPELLIEKFDDMCEWLSDKRLTNNSKYYPVVKYSDSTEKRVIYCESKEDVIEFIFRFM